MQLQDEDVACVGNIPPSIDVRIRSQVLEHFPVLLLVEHHVHALAAMLALKAALSEAEQPVKALPIAGGAGLALPVAAAPGRRVP